MAELGTNWKAFLVQFNPAILGSGVLVSTIITSYSDFYNKPNIQIAILRDDNEATKSSVILSNKGTVPATNLKLLVKMPYNITQVDFFSLENISVQRVGSDTLKVSMPRLVQGEGSVTTINLASKESVPAEDNGYDVYSIYDQGSTKGKTYHSILEVERGEWAPLRLFYFGLLITAALVLYIMVLPWLLGHHYKAKLSRHIGEVYSNYLRTEKRSEDKIDALVKLQKAGTRFDKNVLAKMMKKKTREQLTEILTENFQRIVSDVHMFSTNADKTAYKDELRRLLSQRSKDLHIEDDVLAETDKKIGDYINTL